MKIVKEGEIPYHQTQWYLNTNLTCQNCFTEFRLEPTDTYRVESEKRRDGKTTVTVDCPVCYVTCEFTRGTSHYR